MKELLKVLHDMAERLLEVHDINYLSQCFVKHFSFIVAMT
jgi:hypothetical protein